MCSGSCSGSVVPYGTVHGHVPLETPFSKTPQKLPVIMPPAVMDSSESSTLSRVELLQEFFIPMTQQEEQLYRESDSCKSSTLSAVGLSTESNSL